MFISVIIPTYNEEKFINQCLYSLITQSYPKESFEIIIVDNGSTDKTVATCFNYTQKVYIAPNLTVGGLRNFGADRAIGDIYAFIDADCIADKNWLKNAAYYIEKEKTITGSKCKVPKDAKWIEKVWFSQRPGSKIEVKYINSGNLIVPADIFKEIAGFNSLIETGEDYELCLRARNFVKIISNDEIEVTHLGNPKNLRAFLKREIWHGLGGAGSLKHKWFDLPLFGAIAFSVSAVFFFIGLINIAIGRSYGVIIFSCIFVVLLLLSTIIYRGAHKRKNKEIIQLMLLYCIYYLGRSIALYYIISKKKYQKKPRDIEL
jgi:glycosyltransferase involved in cell wall biosynthesis